MKYIEPESVHKVAGRGTIVVADCKGRPPKIGDWVEVGGDLRSKSFIVVGVEHQGNSTKVGVIVRNPKPEEWEAQFAKDKRARESRLRILLGDG